MAGKQIFLLEPDSIDFDFVYPYSTKTVQLKITNLSEQTREIRQTDFQDYPNLFSVDGDYLPVVLNPKGTSGSSAYVTVLFRAQQFGSFNDIMSFPNVSNPKLYLSAIVPTVYCPDYEFGDVLLADGIQTKSLIIRNDGKSDCTVLSARFANSDTVFKIDSQFPISIPKESQAFINVSFTPSSDVSYDNKIIFQVQTPGIYDSVTVVSGRGIK